MIGKKLSSHSLILWNSVAKFKIFFFLIFLAPFHAYCLHWQVKRVGSLKKIYVVLYPIFYMYIFRLGKHVLPITWVIAILRTYSIYAVVLTPWNKLKRAIDGLSYTPPIWCIIALHICMIVCMWYGTCI